MSDIDDILDKENCDATYCGAPVHRPAKYDAAREELRALRQSVSDAYHRNQGVEIQNAALRAKNAAMREALEATMRCGCSFPAVIVEDDGSRRSVCGLVEAKELARTALGGSHV